MEPASILNPATSRVAAPEKQEEEDATMIHSETVATPRHGDTDALTAPASERDAKSPDDVYAQHALPYAGSPITTDDSVAKSASNQPLSLITSAPTIKSEDPLTPSLQTPTVTKNMDNATLKAIADAQNEYGTRVRPTKKQSETQSSPVEDVPPKPAPTKKRSAPKNGTKKSDPSASRRPPSKKQKIDTGEGISTPRSETPNSTTAKTLKAASANRKHSQSATPVGSSPAPREESVAPSEDGSDDGGIYCICRKPDNHTWMIGCDGGCEDWFHGKCVHISQRDEDLIDKYICPNCETVGRGVTTWKPMCRKEGCRRPARLKKGSESKYCSTECGLAFMKDTIRRTPHGLVSQKLSRKINAGQDEGSESDPGPLGGSIRASELKTLANAAPSVEIFKELGSSQVLTPPASVSPQSPPPPVFSPAEQTRLDEITNRKEFLRQRRALLKDREKFVVMTKERATRTAEKLKVKETCGFDPRLRWDDLTFKAWRESPHGQAAFQQGTLDPDVDTDMVNDDSDQGLDLPEVCSRKRCERHRAWQKLSLQDTRFEEADVGDEMRRIDREERDLRDRAAIQAKMSMVGGDDLEGGTVEVVDVDMT